MSEPKFPKGPWRANAWNILNSYGSRIIQLFPFQYPDTADMALRDLLLAAPDMYEALEDIDETYKYRRIPDIRRKGHTILKDEIRGGAVFTYDDIKKVREALRKARGETE